MAGSKVATISAYAIYTIYHSPIPRNEQRRYVLV